MSLPVLDFELYVDTGDFTPDRCRQSNYGFYEQKFMNKYITVLEDSGLITDYEGSLLLFTDKPHQEDCSDINAFYLVNIR